jgi:tRNA threonylcarbamoyladenosine biosynthesis protein TsaE
MIPVAECIEVADEAAMVELGRRLAPHLAAGMLVYLEGGLGAGKTTLVRGIVQGLGHRGAVKSPTYTLVEPYDTTRLPVFHFDLYRLTDPEELEVMGMRDYLQPQHLCLVEWPDRGFGFLPPADLVITIEIVGHGRTVTLEAGTPAAGDVFAAVSGDLRDP